MWLSIEHGTMSYSRTMCTTSGEYSSSASAASGATRWACWVSRTVQSG